MGKRDGNESLMGEFKTSGKERGVENADHSLEEFCSMGGGGSEKWGGRRE